MAQKRINDLQLRTDFDATCNMPSDDLTQTWRITGAQILAYVKAQFKALTIVTAVSGDYVQINDVSDSDNPKRALISDILALAAPKIATIKDVKASGTAGGTASSGSQTRVLNTLSDPSSIVTSLTSNQFILPAGTYFIEGSAPGMEADGHKARLRNITDSTTAIIGSQGYGYNATNNGTTHSHFMGHVTIAAPKTFEVQHNFQTGKATSGLGNACSTGESEIYTQVKIQKLA